MEAQADGFWAEEQVVFPGKSGQDAIRLRLFPTGVLRARIEPPRGESPPKALAVRFQPAPGTGGKTGLPKEATVSCPVREAVWECAVPAGRLDLRIKSEGLIPVYQWGTGVEPGKKKDLGALSLRRGASVAGWVQLEGGEPPARPVRVALSTQTAAYSDTPHDAERLRSLARETRTNERGFFQIEGVIPGSYVVTDEKGRFQGALPEEGTWPLALTSEENELQLNLKPVQVKRLPGKRAASVDVRVPDTTLAGEVVDDKGRKVPGAQVSLIREGMHLISTDEDGEFEFRGIEPGLAGVEAQEQDRTSGMVEVTVSEDRNAPRLRLVLRQATQIRGRVSSSAGPVPGAELLAFPSVSDVPFAAGVEAVTRADGSFTLSFPANVQAFHLTVFAPGYAFRMLPVVVERGKTLEIPVETSGGTLVLEMPGLRREDPQPLLAHNGTFTPLPLLSRWTRLQRVQSRDPGRIVVPNMEAGDYSLCRNAHLELRQGKEPPGDRCVSGFLAPHGELVLRLGGSSEKREEASPLF